MRSLSRCLRVPDRCGMDLVAVSPPAIEPCDGTANHRGRPDGRTVQRAVSPIELRCDVGERAALSAKAAETARTRRASCSRITRPFDRHTAARAKGSFGQLGYHETPHGITSRC